MSLEISYKDFIDELVLGPRKLEAVAHLLFGTVLIKNFIGLGNGLHGILGMVRA